MQRRHSHTPHVVRGQGGDILSVVNPGHHASSDRHAFAAKRVTDDVHLLLQSGTGPKIELRGAVPERRLLDCQEGKVDLRRVGGARATVRAQWRGGAISTW